MTGFDSKRQAAKAKLDDDTQVYADTLLIVYQRGFADGKAAQRKPLTDEEKKKIATVAGCTDDDDGHIVTEIFRLAEAKLKEKNDH